MSQHGSITHQVLENLIGATARWAESAHVDLQAVVAAWEATHVDGEEAACQGCIDLHAAVAEVDPTATEHIDAACLRNALAYAQTACP